MSVNIYNIVQYYHFLISEFLTEDSINIDCTCGNGNDSLYLCNAMKGKGFLYAFDVQEEAIKKTQKLLLKSSKFNNYKVIHDSHVNVDRYILKKVQLAVFNLGYLPESKSDISTNPDTTIFALEKILKILKLKGYILITAYTGHDKGLERNALFDYLEKLDDKLFKVVNHRIININNYTPELFIIHKMHETD
ncbi:MAG: SAM-dependent methyltransferase, MraW methylase family [Clostridiales bacterium 38_11]|nr:MAG: SAM-dependent methyltransferase, MraW methylase family [Clostridiales bacterium 38_11]